VLRKTKKTLDVFKVLVIAGSLLVACHSTALAQGEKEDGDDQALPLEGETRKLSFSTDEGTWMSLDVTPDGKSIFFDLLGDIYRLPIDGGSAIRVTEGLPYDNQPKLSPDGQWMAYISDKDGADNLWISKIDGSSPRKLTSETAGDPALYSPVWTPDGQYLIVALRAGKDDGFKMFHRDGGEGVMLTGQADSGGSADDGDAGGGEDEGGLRGNGPAITPDGKTLYFALSTGDESSTMLPVAQIGRFDFLTGEVDTITQAQAGAVRPVVSPDGNLLTYAIRYETQTGLRVRDLNSGADRWLKWPIQRDSQERSAGRDQLPGYAFTPDSKAIIISYEGKFHRIDVDTGETHDIPFTANVDLDVGPDLTASYRIDQGPVRATIIHDPQISPNGGIVVMSVLSKLYVMDTKPGATPKRLTSGDAREFKPVWSPDGRWIAFVTWSMDEGGHIWKVRASGGRAERLTKTPAFYTDIVFSPDGKRIIAMQSNESMGQQTQDEQLVWLSASGGETKLIMHGRGARYPHFANDPKRIFVSQDGGLVSVRYDGSDKRSHLTVTSPGTSFEPFPELAKRVIASPDGQWALALIKDQVWVVAMPLTGGTAPSIDISEAVLPAAQLTDIGADNISWADGGDTVVWSIGSSIYRRPFSSIEFWKDDDGEEDEKAKQPLDFHEAVVSLNVPVEVPRATPQGVVVLKNANIIAMAGATTKEMARVQANADIVITNNRITAVGRSGSLTIPAGAEIIDASGKFIVPGFIDTHAHWDFRTAGILEPDNWSLAVNLAYGVTAGLDVQTGGEEPFSYRDMVDTGQTLGQRAFMTGKGIFGTNDFQSYEATHAYLKRYADHYRTKNLKAYVVGNRKQRQWLVKASKELGLMPTTEGSGDLMLNLTHAIDGMHGNEHNFPITPIYKDVIELHVQTQTAYTPTLGVSYNAPRGSNYFLARTEVHDDAKLNRFYPHNELDGRTQRVENWMRDDEYMFDEMAGDAAKLQRAGGLVGVGAHGEVNGIAYHWEMWGYAMGDMTPAEVLRAATIDGAKIIGVDQDIGSLEPGKLADLLVLDANPLEDMRNTNTIRYVMKNGELYEADTLNQLWPQKKQFAPSWWWWKEDSRP
jgi:Tol biopolymer transport system component/predicted amidohydrolase